MPALAPFLSALSSSGADCLHLAGGETAALEHGTRRRPITKQTFTRAQLVALLGEIAPPEALEPLRRGEPVRFGCSVADAAYRVEVGDQHGAMRVRITNGKSAAAPPASAAAPRAYVHPAGNEARATAAAEAGARAEMESLLRVLAERGGSDLHMRVGEPPMLRADGELRRLDGHAVLTTERVEAMLGSIMPERNREEFVTVADTDFAYEIEGLARFRANALRDRRGAAAVFRVIPATVVTVDQLGISHEVRKLCSLTKGLVLVTGPTGSGKSTTLCSLIDLVNRERNDHVITIEDPIEFVHENKSCLITQRQVGVHTKSFKQALRAALREDPDIILVGELRDLETVSIAIETAETGHLVFGTLHTTTAASTVDRLIDQFPADRQEQIRQMLAESLKGVISQTLCKKIGGGRVAAREVLLSNPAVSNLIREGKTFQIPSIMQTSRRLGMVTLNDALLELVDAAQVEPKEAYLKAVDKTGLVAGLKARGKDVGFAEEGVGRK
jgi:twitching motility protein PilT